MGHSPGMTVRAHGWAGLAPFASRTDSSLKWAVKLPVVGPVVVTIRWDSTTRTVSACSDGVLAGEAMEFLEDRLAWMFRRDESFEKFWAVCRSHGTMKRIAELRAGALLRSGSLFEDVVKTLCTVNCTWGNTRRMVEGLCELFGRRVPNTHPEVFTFPEPEILAEASEDDLRAAKLGFRARWIHHLAVQAASGEVDPNSWTGREDVAALRKELLALKGVGPYAANHMLMMLGHYGFIPADSEAASRLGLPPGTPTAVIEREAVERYAGWGEYAFLAYRFEGLLERLDG